MLCWRVERTKQKRIDVGELEEKEGKAVVVMSWLPRGLDGEAGRLVRRSLLE